MFIYCPSGLYSEKECIAVNSDIFDHVRVSAKEINRVVEYNAAAFMPRFHLQYIYVVLKEVVWQTGIKPWGRTIAHCHQIMSIEERNKSFWSAR